MVQIGREIEISVAVQCDGLYYLCRNISQAIEAPESTTECTYVHPSIQTGRASVLYNGEGNPYGCRWDEIRTSTDDGQSK